MAMDDIIEKQDDLRHFGADPSDVETVKSYYDSAPEKEWARLGGRYRVEFEVNCRFLERYIKPGDRVLDVGGGPGRYSLWLAEHGCDVTLLDLSDGNVGYAKRLAAERGLHINAIAGDARYTHELVSGEFDHVLLMGPLYHLLDEADRVASVESCLKVLKKGGTLAAAFISFYGCMHYDLRDTLLEIISGDAERERQGREFLALDLPILERQESYAGDGFTRMYCVNPHLAEEFMRKFPLEKLEFFGSEGVLAPYLNTVDRLPADIYERCLDFAERMNGRAELLGMSEHLLYIARKV